MYSPVRFAFLLRNRLYRDLSMIENSVPGYIVYVTCVDFDEFICCTSVLLLLSLMEKIRISATIAFILLY